jgi:hypothetical protein
MSDTMQQQDLLKASPFASPLVGKQSVHPLITPGSLKAAGNAIPQKPMRPLTAYHIFFQIERELIIQTTEGEIANKSSLDNKVYLDDVPQRYKTIMLLPDWYAGPGKRKKRKHRKQHGKIGFLELSRVISARWAELDEIDPETKAFVQKIAQSEIEEYYLDMKRYKELTKGMVPGMSKLAACSTPPKKSGEKRRRSSISDGNDFVVQMQQQQPLSGAMPSCLDMVASSLELMQLQIQLQTEIDHFLSCIEKRKQELFTSHFAAKKSQLDISNPVPLPFQFEKPVQKKVKKYHPHEPVSEMTLLEQNTEMPIHFIKPATYPRTISASLSSCLSPTPADELEIGDDEIMSFWKIYHN